MNTWSALKRTSSYDYLLGSLPTGQVGMTSYLHGRKFFRVPENRKAIFSEHCCGLTESTKDIIKAQCLRACHYKDHSRRLVKIFQDKARGHFGMFLHQNLSTSAYNTGKKKLQLPRSKANFLSKNVVCSNMSFALLRSQSTETENVLSRGC